MTDSKPLYLDQLYPEIILDILNLACETLDELITLIRPRDNVKTAKLIPKLSPIPNPGVGNINVTPEFMDILLTKITRDDNISICHNCVSLYGSRFVNNNMCYACSIKYCDCCKTNYLIKYRKAGDNYTNIICKYCAPGYDWWFCKKNFVKLF